MGEIAEGVSEDKDESWSRHPMGHSSITKLGPREASAKEAEKEWARRWCVGMMVGGTRRL